MVNTPLSDHDFKDDTVSADKVLLRLKSGPLYLVDIPFSKLLILHSKVFTLRQV